MSVMTSQILRSVDFTKSKKPRYLEIETSFSLHIKKFINCTSKATLWQKILNGKLSFLCCVTCKFTARVEIHPGLNSILPMVKVLFVVTC